MSGRRPTPRAPVLGLRKWESQQGFDRKPTLRPRVNDTASYIMEAALVRASVSLGADPRKA